jgi:hypothetical protein
MTFPILGGNGAVAGYSIDNSLRFNDGDTPRLDKTFSTSNRKTWTWSCWVKRSTVSNANQRLISYFIAPNQTFIRIDSSDRFEFFAGGYKIVSSAKLRDVSAWYHLQISIDTTQATASNRAKMYINGVQINDFDTATYVPQNTDTFFNYGATQICGDDSASPNEVFDGYMAEMHFIDGQQLDASSFGEFDADSGIWKPISYSGSYGTNGFYLDFENSGSLGADQSGNGNNFTPTNLASTDQTTDTPTNNFATLNSLHRYTDRFSEGNLKLNGVQKTGTPVELQTSTLGATSGKWYWEVKFEWTGSLASTFARIGIGTELSVPPNPNSSNDEGSVVMIEANKGATLSFRNLNSSPTTNTTGFNTLDPDDIFMFALDIDNKKLFIGKNGTWYNSADPVAGTNAQAYSWTFSNGDITFPVIAFYSGDTASNTYNHTLLPNFGNPAFSISSGNSDGNGYGNFEYAPPSGYLALCTQNLATELFPTIDDGSQYFNTVLYTGNGSTNNITGVGFQPGFVWTKLRSQAGSHSLADVIRGGTAVLRSDLTDAEVTRANHIQSFDSDGFTLGPDGTSNLSGRTNVAWNWKANAGSTSSNTDGSITSTVQANTTAGFSIVTYTGNGTASTIGHGLGVKPKVVILKNRSSATDWLYLTDVIDGSNDLLNLNQTGAKSDSGLAFTSTTFATGSGGGSGGSGSNYVAYCFAEIEGYSKFNKYTGNGSTDGTMINLSFRPAWVLYKKSSATENWHIVDNKRDTLNPNSFGIDPNTAGAEANDANLQMDFLSNGFKLRTSHGTANGSGETYIYMAFAENPFVSSTGISVTAR